MLLEQERNDVIRYSLNSVADGLTNGTAGNISIYNRQKKIIAISPTGMAYDTMQPQDVSIIDETGKLIEGKKPSSEWQMHLKFYQNRQDINAVFHGHTIYATTVACLNVSLPAIDYMVAISNQTEVPCAKYATYGTKELAKNAWDAGKCGNAVLLANHGVLTYGNSIDHSYKIALQIEYVAKLYVLALQTGKQPAILSEQEMLQMIEKFKTYGK